MVLFLHLFPFFLAACHEMISLYPYHCPITMLSTTRGPRNHALKSQTIKQSCSCVVKSVTEKGKLTCSLKATFDFYLTLSPSLETSFPSLLMALSSACPKAELPEEARQCPQHKDPKNSEVYTRNRQSPQKKLSLFWNPASWSYLGFWGKVGW